LPIPEIYISLTLNLSDRGAEMKKIILVVAALAGVAGLPSASMALANGTATSTDDDPRMCSYEVCDEHWVPVCTRRPNGVITCE
jgi:hypothetical protein